MTDISANGLRLEPSTIRAIVKKSVDLLESKCIRLGDIAPDWRGLFAANEASLERTDSKTAFEAEMNNVLAQGRLSHVAFFHGSGSSAPARYAINATFCPADFDGNGERWMFQDVHLGGPAERAGIRPGDILLEVNGEPFRPPILPTFPLGKDADLLVCRGDGLTASIRVVLPKVPTNGKPGARPPMAEPTSVTASMLHQEVGYVRVPAAKPTISQVWKPRGTTPRGTGRRSLTGDVPGVAAGSDIATVPVART